MQIGLLVDEMDDGTAHALDGGQLQFAFGHDAFVHGGTQHGRALDRL